MDIDSFKNDLGSKTPEDIYNKYLIGGDVWYFRNFFGDSWFKQYDTFKLFISNKLEVHYNDIALAGSGKLGFSISPKKIFTSFNDNSDLDIIIISRKYYCIFWEAYIKDSYAEIQTNNFRKICFSIFRRYIDFSGFSISNQTYAEWLRKTGDFEKDLQTEFNISHKINYRIFESWDSAKLYYLNSIKKAMDIFKGLTTCE